MDNIEQIIDELGKGATAVKPAPHPFMLSMKWLAIGAAYLLVSLAVSGLRADLAHALQDPWFIAELAALCGLIVSVALSTAVLAFPDLHQQQRSAFAPLWMFAFFLLAMAFAWKADVPPAPLPVHSFECTISILLFSLLPSAGTFYAIRGLASTHPRLSGIMAVLFAFSIGALWLRLHEVNDSISHVIVWHYLPMIAFGALGMWLGKKFLKW